MLDIVSRFIGRSVVGDFQRSFLSCSDNCSSVVGAVYKGRWESVMENMVLCRSRLCK